MNFRYYLLAILTTLSFQGLTQNLAVQSGDAYPSGIGGMVEKVFKGEGVEIIDVSFEGESYAMGYFTQGTLATSIDRGLVLTTGKADSVAQLNYSGNLSTTSSGNRIQESNLEAILKTQGDAVQLYDVIKLVIRFIPAADKIQFNYVFSSEEYPEFTCGIYNDVFGFFVDGPKPSGGEYQGKNIATIPGSGEIVAINSVHNGNPLKPECLPAHPEYYIPIPDQSPWMTYNARLQKFKATLDVIPCMPYTITLSLGDVADDRYDTGIFIEANSFSSDPLAVSLTTPIGDGTIIEGCTPAHLRIALPTPAKELTHIPYTISGNALEGADFPFIGELSFGEGDSIQNLTIPALVDQLVENEELLQIIFSPTECSQDTIDIRIRDFVHFLTPEINDTVLCESQNITYDFSSVDEGSLKYRNISNQNIPDSGSLEASLILNDLPFKEISYLGVSQICVQLDHSNTQDLSIYLENPAGDRLCLIKQNDHTIQNGLQNLCFAINVPDVKHSDTDYIAPCGAQENWFSTPIVSAEGMWKIIIIDHKIGSIGKLNHWSIEFLDQGTASYNWYFNQNLICENCSSIDFAPKNSGFLKLEQMDLYGCRNIDSGFVDLISAKSIDNIECLTADDKMLFTWSDVKDIQYFVSRDSMDWIRPNHGKNAHIISPVIPGRTYHLYVKTVSSCNQVIRRFSCTAAPCKNPEFAISAKHEISCHGARDGKVQFQSSNQTLTYWINGQWKNDGDFNNLAAGDYMAIAQASNGCRNFIEFSLKAPPPIQASYEIMRDVSCYGIENGSVRLDVKHNQGDFMAFWDNQEMGISPQKLHAGTNRVKIRDENNCELTMSVKLNKPAPIEFSAQIKPTACGIPKSGSIQLFPSGGVGDIRILWPEIQIRDTFLNGIDSGRYILTMMDANDCKIDTSLFVPYIPPLNLKYSKGDAACSASGYGFISLHPQGGGGQYQINWNNNSNAENLVNLKPGTYCVTVSDQIGCIDEVCIPIEDEYEIFQQTEIIQPNCITGPLGEIKIDLKDEYHPYSLIWTGPHRYQSNGHGIRALEFGTYTAFISDRNGCFHTESFKIEELDTLIYGVDQQHVKCFGESDGNLTVNVTQSNGLVWYSLDSTDWKLNPLFRNLTAATYDIYLRDEADCTSRQEIEIMQPDSMILTLGPDTTIYYGEEFELKPLIENGQGSIQYQWQLPDYLNSNCMDCPFITLLPDQSFTAKLRIYDENGCTAEDFLRVFVSSGDDIEVPTIFTPNGDGNNDLLVIHGSPGIYIISFEVFDQQGNLVYQDADISVNDLQRGWDGNLQSREAPTGIYLWNVNAKLANGKPAIAKGLTILHR